MRRERLLELVAALKERFEALELQQPLALARQYEAAVLAGHSVGPRHEVRVHRHGAWSAAAIVRWMGMLQIPPFQDRFPVQPLGAPCPICKRSDAVHSTGMLPGTELFHCGADGKTWRCPV